MKVLKFGGTSLKNLEKFLIVQKIIEEKAKNEQIGVVLSAPEKITNYLVESIQESTTRKNLTQLNFIEKIINQFLFELKKNIPLNLLENLKKEINKEILNLKNTLQKISLLDKCPNELNAMIISRGEIFSVFIMKAILKSKKYDVTIIDPVKNLVGTGEYLNSTINIKLSKEKIKKLKIPKKNVILMPGFIAGNKNKKLVVLGRNGSDYSAAILTVCLEAQSCEIWTDVDGVFTADPKIVKDAKLLKNLTYSEALDLSYFGAKVLHPKTITPLEKFNIPCIIKNTLNLNNVGTIIKGFKKNNTFSIKGITYVNDITIFNISGLEKKEMLKVNSTFYSKKFQKKISPILIFPNSSNGDISFCISNKNVKKTFEKLQKEFNFKTKIKLTDLIKTIDDVSIISIIGNGFELKKNIYFKIFSGLQQNYINVLAILKDPFRSSISIVTNKFKISKTIQNIHDILFNKNRKVIEVFLTGIGGVGKTLLNQLKKQQKILLKKNIDIKICSISNSKKVIFNKKGIELTNWEKKFKNSQNLFNLTNLLNKIKKNNFTNPIFVDCTSSEKIADKYIDILSNRMHIVASNKKANTSNYKLYENIRLVSKKYDRKFLYETNVGAGLPVIENFQNLLNSGDKLIQFRGILSGSLSYIFGKLDEGIPLSEATMMAKELGFTEPNPLDDLSGIDVARKLLILAREMGYNLELSDIKIESLLPKNFNLNLNINDFFIEIKKLNTNFSNKVEEAKKENKTLRFVGIIEKNGQCKVTIQKINENDPLYFIKNGENALAFYTEYYQPNPLVLKGYGAGNNVTAAGVFSDLLRTLSYNLGT
ncbi:bifunctional aspartate kinase/homoserine dehydrogenase I [Buchnera aphidicola (Mindarus keteleerifoliae)]|uniref:bifunctional aspartate kinase/homoserine dehydrogenase I n=1 Tax=Buchnera aphidicola TaxID=9 RepID=UPI0031B6E710